jgi:hypothetical protein
MRLARPYASRSRRASSRVAAAEPITRQDRYEPGSRECNLDEDMSVHILTTSAVMLGVCMTVVGVLHVLTVMSKVDTLGDDLLSINSMIYLGACLCAYWALRTRRRQRNVVLEHIADALFLVGLVISAIATGVITWFIAGS